MPNTQNLRPVLTYYRNHEPMECLARFNLGERVCDHEGHAGVVEALYGAGPIFEKLIVRFDMGLTVIAHDDEIVPLQVH